MRAWFISDTHGMHEQLTVPSGIDVVFCAGDIANERDPGINANEVTLFLLWFEQLPIKHKILIAGNHDTSIEKRLIRPKEFKGIIYLEHEEYCIDEPNHRFQTDTIKIFGSPYTPSFNNWAFNKDRSKLQRYWEVIPDDVDILITHGPPKGMLDLSYDKEDNLSFRGCKALWNKVIKIKPQIHAFGHIHDMKGCFNYGTRFEEESGITFINAALVEDGKFEKGLIHNGIIMEM